MISLLQQLRASRTSPFHVIRQIQSSRLFTSSCMHTSIGSSPHFSPANEEVTHIVFFSFPNNSDLEKAMSFYSALTQKATRGGKPYILEAKCGRTQQHEPIRDGGYNLLSVLTFKNDEDRAFFVKQDPAHLELKDMITGKMDKTQMVLDFVSGK